MYIILMVKHLITIAAYESYYDSFKSYYGS